MLHKLKTRRKIVVSSVSLSYLCTDAERYFREVAKEGPIILREHTESKNEILLFKGVEPNGECIDGRFGRSAAINLTNGIMYLIKNSEPYGKPHMRLIPIRNMFPREIKIIRKSLKLRLMRNHGIKKDKILEMLGSEPVISK